MLRRVSRSIWLRLALPAALALLGALPASAQDAAALRFERDGEPLEALSLGELRERCGARLVEVAHDPYYGGPKRFWACPLGAVLALGFGAAPAPDSRENFFFRARDGYAKAVSGARLAEPGGWLAFADADLTPQGAAPAWQPIERRQVDPAPFYVVWTGAGQDDAHRYPWPYQLVAIEIAPFASRFPHTVPDGEPEAGAAWRGFTIFRSECSACHAINGEGGTVGPELNVPRSIVEYRPAAQIKAYVRDPQSFRYTSMPAHPHLGDADLDALVAYFEAMSQRKHDPHQPR